MKSEPKRITTKGRNTGKTFRAVLHALIAASEGKDVVFISNHSRHAFQFAASIASHALSQDVLSINRGHLKIQILKGRIQFMVETADRLRGRQVFCVQD